MMNAKIALVFCMLPVGVYHFIVEQNMNIEAVKQFCLSFPGVVEKESGAPSNVLVYYVGDKFFAYFKTSEPERWRFSFRVTPERFLELTDQPGIKPARYMHRFHWVTVVALSSIHADYLKELLIWSYQKAFTRLSKKLQQQILSNQA